MDEHVDRDTDTWYSQPDNGDCVAFTKGRAKITHPAYDTNESSGYPSIAGATAENTAFLSRLRKFQEDATVTKPNNLGSCEFSWKGKINIPLQCGVFQPYQTRKKIATGNSLSSFRSQPVRAV